MADLTLSGYLAAAQSIAWSSGQTLNSMVDNEFTDLSNEVDNSTTKYPFVDIEIVLASAAFTGTDSGVEVFLIPSQDESNYPSWSGDVTADRQQNVPFFVGFCPTTGTTAAQRMVLRDVALPNGKFKWGFRNRGNVTTAGSGNSATWRPHSFAGT